VPVNPYEVPLKSRDGSPFLIAPHPVLAVGKTCYVGEPIALVIAETLSHATDAAERLAVEYYPLPAVTRSADALAPKAPLVWDEHGTNLCVDSEAGDQAATERAFAQAAHVVGLETAINRVTGVPMELRAAVGVYDDTTERYTVYTSAGGGVVRQRDDIAAVLRVPAAAVRVISGDVGGNFGIRNDTYPELALVVWAARPIGRPVKWSCERRDAFSTDFHGRDLTSEAELALDEHGRFLAIRAINTSNLGASAISFVPLAKGIAVSSSVYDIPCSHMQGRAVVTNTSPTSAYRSAGRPEVAFVLERLIDIRAAATASTASRSADGISWPRGRCRTEIRWVSSMTAATTRPHCGAQPNWPTGQGSRPAGPRHAGATAAAASASALRSSSIPEHLASGPR
jgi:carbon-monoxide dehydrogenase large subunit